MLNMNFYKRILFISLFFLSSVSFTQLITNDSINILFIGNSYTHMNNMPAIFDKIANAKGKLVHVEKNTQSGASFQVHTTRLDLYESIKSRNWDFIVLQGYSRELSHTITHIDSATIPFLNQIIEIRKIFSIAL